MHLDPAAVTPATRRRCKAKIIGLALLHGAAWFGGAVAAPPSAPPDQAALQRDIATNIAKKFASGGRYVVGSDTPAHPHQFCKALAADDPVLTNPLVHPYAGLAGSANGSILDCTYPFGSGGRQGWVLVVAASADNIATRIVGACLEAVPAKAAACANRMLDADWRVPWGANNFIFPITGFVDEPCGKTNADLLIGFRHGVTIQYGSSATNTDEIAYCSSGKDDQGPDWQRQVALTNATAEVFAAGRIAAVARDAVPGKSFPPKTAKPGLEADSFQAYVRDNEIRAVETGYDYLMVVKAAQVMNAKAPPAH